MMRYVLITFLLLFLIFSSVSFAAGILMVDGESIADTPDTFLYAEEKYIEIEPVLQALGFETFWNEMSYKLVFKNDQQTGVLSTRSPYMAYGPKLIYLSKKPLFLDGRLCVCFSFVQNELPSLVEKKIALTDFEFSSPPPPLGLPYRPLFLKRIVLDPGHGGHDSGAKSPEGLKEKDINLAVAHRLARKLKEEMGIDVIMTRSDDRFITLGERARIANTSEADLFMSIHANGAFNKVATGTETYFLALEASDRKAAKLAAFENASIRFEKSNPLAESEMDDLKKILWDMVRTEVLKDSEKLATAVQTKLERQLHLPSRGVKQAPFYVLMGSSIPAILVEIGFMTTSEEADQLASPRFQERIAGALFMALLHYDTLRAAESEQ